MEYLFLFVFIGSVVMYLLDRKGWNATAKRLSNIVRANIESGKAVKAIEPVKQFDDWENQFKAIENPLSVAPMPMKKARHEIVKTDFYNTHLGPWPQWTCRCGQNGHEAVLGSARGMQDAIGRAKRAGEAHIKSATEADEMKAKSNGAFAW